MFGFRIKRNKNLTITVTTFTNFLVKAEIIEHFNAKTSNFKDKINENIKSKDKCHPNKAKCEKIKINAKKPECFEKFIITNLTGIASPFNVQFPFSKEYQDKWLASSTADLFKKKGVFSALNHD